MVTYLRWSVTVPPFKVTNLKQKIRWSRWPQSMRKDVECTFGILKGRWRVLKTGICLQGEEIVDRIWLTCCALRNWLLEIDGLDEEWCDVVATNIWLGDLGRHDFEGLPDNIPNAIARISTNLEPRNYDVSGMGVGEDVTEFHPVELDLPLSGEQLDRTNMVGDVRRVRHLGLGFFRQKLVKHFDILWR